MSRSYLKTKRFREYFSWIREEKNPHKIDEMPKNKAPKSITKYCKDDIEHLNRPTYCSGHSTNRGRRMVSGLVRAAKKRETQKLLKEVNDE